MWYFSLSNLHSVVCVYVLFFNAFIFQNEIKNVLFSEYASPTIDLLFPSC